MQENKRLITLFVNSFERSISVFLVDHDRQDFAESEFVTRSTKSGVSFFKFIHAEGATVFTPSAWINIEML